MYMQKNISSDFISLVKSMQEKFNFKTRRQMKIYLNDQADLNLISFI